MLAAPNIRARIRDDGNFVIESSADSITWATFLHIDPTPGRISIGDDSVLGNIDIVGTLTAPDIVCSTGDIVATLGQVNAGTTMTAGTGITATTGNIVATTGNVQATAGDLVATAGHVICGEAATFLESTVALTDGAGAGAGTILNAPAAGNPNVWCPITINGIAHWFPAWHL